MAASEASRKITFSPREKVPAQRSEGGRMREPQSGAVRAAIRGRAAERFWQESGRSGSGPVAQNPEAFSLVRSFE
jgi:hypothetical protein